LRLLEKRCVVTPLAAWLSALIGGHRRTCVIIGYQQKCHMRAASGFCRPMGA
jgi:hypothetical protein